MKVIIEMTKEQAKLVLNALEKRIESNHDLECDYDISKEDRFKIKEERLEIEMVARQIMNLIM